MLKSLSTPLILRGLLALVVVFAVFAFISASMQALRGQSGLLNAGPVVDTGSWDWSTSPPAWWSWRGRCPRPSSSFWS